MDARLWQDPIGVAQKQKALLDEQIDKGVAKKGATKLHDITALCNLLCERADRFQAPGSVLLLAVMPDAGPYSEQAESRLRARQAVLEGLSESGFLPIDGEHIGFVAATWPPPEANAPSPAIERALVLPWEECEAIDDPKHVFPPGARRVVVVWLPAVKFENAPRVRQMNNDESTNDKGNPNAQMTKSPEEGFLAIRISSFIRNWTFVIHLIDRIASG